MSLLGESEIHHVVGAYVNLPEKIPDYISNSVKIWLMQLKIWQDKNSFMFLTNKELIQLVFTFLHVLKTFHWSI